MKVITIVGTRPEIIRLSETIKVLDQVFDHILVHTGQNYDYELNQVFFEELGIREPDYFLNAADQSPIVTISQVMCRTDELLADLKPDAILILGDTNSALAAYPAKRRHVPIFHMEAGNRCFDFRVPEEINRKLVDHLSDINMPYTEHARRYLLAEGLPADQIIKTGSPLLEVLRSQRKSIDEVNILECHDLTAQGYLVVSLHREENVDQPKRIEALVESLNKVAVHLNFPLIFPVHPRTLRRLKESASQLNSLVRPVKPLGYHEYVALQESAYCVLSDSGSVTEESNLLGFPAVTLRQAHERPEGMDEGAVVMCDLVPDQLLMAIKIAVKQNQVFGPAKICTDYDVEQVSWKVAKIIMGYVDYIRRNVWKEADT